MAEDAMSAPKAGETSSRFYKTLAQVEAIAGALLLLNAGIAVKATIPLIHVELESAEKLSYVLGATLLYCLVVLWVCWSTAEETFRQHSANRIHFILGNTLAAIALWFVLRDLAGDTLLWHLPIGWTSALLVAGVISGFCAENLIEVPFVLRSRVYAQRVGVGRLPSVTKLKIWIGLCVILVSLMFALYVWRNGQQPLASASPWIFLSSMGAICLPGAGKETLRSLLGKKEGTWHTIQWTKVASYHLFLEANLLALNRENNPPHGTPFEEAADSGDVATLRQFISLGADPNLTCWLDMSPLMLAINGSHAEAALYLLDNGARANRRTLLGDTPLLLATIRNMEHVVRRLVDAGADVNASRRSSVIVGDGRTALWYAAGLGNIGMLTSLLDAGANPNLAEEKGVTPLMMARSAPVASLLLERGADPNAKTAIGKTALMGAAGLGFADVVDLLLQKGANISALDAEGKSAIQYAEEAGFGQIAVKLRHVVSIVTA